jgi:hypothetical protein
MCYNANVITHWSAFFISPGIIGVTHNRKIGVGWGYPVCFPTGLRSFFAETQRFTDLQLVMLLRSSTIIPTRCYIGYSSRSLFECFYFY